jgi:hypothetical protein
MAGLILAAALAARPAATTPEQAGLVIGLGVAGVALTALAWWWPPSLGIGLAALIAEYAVFVLLNGGHLDRWAPVEAGVLVTTAELMAWAGERQMTVKLEPDPGLGPLRVGLLLVSFLGSLVVGGLIFLSLGLGSAVAAAWEIVGGLAILAIAALAASAMRRLNGPV